MMYRILIILLLMASVVRADPVKSAVDEALAGLRPTVSDEPYSRTIERMYIGLDGQGRPRIGVAYREIESFKPITGVVVVERTDAGFVLREALFPDITKIRNAEERRQVQSILAQFRNVPFDPHAEKSAVDGLTGATRYGLKTSGYLNYMARRVALEMENPSDWVGKE